jgi:hypothetical protein
LAKLIPSREEASVHLKTSKRPAQSVAKKGETTTGASGVGSVDKAKDNYEDIASHHQETKLKVHQVAGLDCGAYGGPPDASDMVYWHDIPTGADYVSQLKLTTETKYITFEPDQGMYSYLH